MRWALPTLRGLLFAALPFLIYWSLQHLEARVVSVLLLLLLLLRAPLGTLRRALGGIAGLLLALAVILLAAALWRANEALWVLLYPVLVNAALLALFTYTLWRPPSAIERMARMRTPHLPPEGMRYTRRVTQVWCGFFVVNGGIAAWTALAAPREIWALYNGLIAYLLMGALFALEWLYRRARFGAASTR